MDDQSNFDAILADWMSRIDLKTEEITNNLDNGVLQAAIFCNTAALENAMNTIYNNPIPTNVNGTPVYKRTGLYKAAMGYGMNPDKSHSSMIFNAAPYASILEFGDSQGRQGKSILSDAIFNNTDTILSIIASNLGV
jgi:hypothetical protein